MTVGALAVREGRFETLHPLFETRRTNPYGSGSGPLVGSLPGEAGRRIGTALMAQVDSRNYFAPEWEALKRDLDGLGLLQDRYPEFIAGEEEPDRSLVEFDFVHRIALGLQEERVISKWSMSSHSTQAFARRLYGDARLRTRVAEAVGEDLAGFDQKAPQALRSSYLLGQDPYPDAIPILEGGAR